MGQIAAVGDEASFVRRIETGSFAGMDLCFFAGEEVETRRHWEAAHGAGAGVVDLTGALRGEAGVVVQVPWVKGAAGSGRVGRGVDLATRAVIPAHPVAAMLGLVAGRCLALALRGVGATVLVPASERGQRGMDEMHQQTVSLLSFQSLPREEFDAQVAFNLLPRLGDAAKVGMEATAARIREDYAAAGTLPSLALQMVHAPVFHGYAVSMLLDFDGAVSAEDVERALAGEHIAVVGAEDDAPSNLSAAGQGDVLAQVTQAGDRRVWVWMAADNLKVAALQAIACGMHLRSVRPHGTVQ